MPWNIPVFNQIGKIRDARVSEIPALTVSGTPDIIEIQANGLIPADLPVMDNFPFIFCSFAIASVNIRLDNHPPKGVIEASSLFIHQGLKFLNSTERGETITRFTTLRTANPGIIIIIHCDYLTIKFDQDFSANVWLEDQAMANPSDFEQYYLRRTSGGDFICHENKAGEGLAFNWDCNNTVMQRVVDGQLTQYTDFDGANNLMPTFALNWMHDTIPEKDSRYANAAHSGTITSAFTLTEIDIPTWPSPPLGSSAGDGYLALTLQTNLVVLDSNKTAGDYAQITGHKVVNGSTDRLRINTSLENMSVNSGDIFSLLPRNGKHYGSSTAGEMSDSEWRTGIRNFADRFISTALSEQGVAVDSYYNAGSFQASRKREGTAPVWPTSEYIGAWGGMHYERIGLGLGFFNVNPGGGLAYHTDRQDPPGGAAGGVDYNEANLVESIEYNKLMLKPNDETASKYPCIWLNAQVRKLEPSTPVVDMYTSLTVLDAAFARFWCCLAWTHDNVMPQVEIDKGHDVPVMIDEMLIFAGNPISTRNYGTYDPEGDSGNGSFLFRIADFGPFGYVFEYGNCLIIINIRKPDSDPWIPHWQAGGQSINISKDRWTVDISPGSGNKWQRFDRVTYTNNSTGKFDGKKATDYDTNEKILKDDVWNDPTLGPQPGGGYLVGDDIDVGPLETIVLMRVDE